MLASVWTDIHGAVKSLSRARAFTAAVLVTLALGIGANTAIFSLLNAVILRTMPVAEPRGLVFVGQFNPRAADAGVSFLSNPPWLMRIREETGIFAGVAAYNLRDFKVVSAGGVEQVVGQYATGNYHSLLGVPMALGRGFSGERDFGGASDIAVISDAYWQRRYQRNPEALGARLEIGGRSVTVVGITAPGFEGLQPGRSIEITLPLSIRVEDERGFATSADSWTNMPLVARLRPGVTAAAAEPVVDAAFREHMATPGIGFGRTRDGRFVLTAAVVPAARGADRLRREYEPALAVLMAIVVIVLLVACVNVANLFLARGSARASEIAMRLAVGAGRSRIVRQILAEALLLALGGGVLGFVVAGGATQYVATLLRDSQRPVVIDLQPDLLVLAYTLGVAGLCTLLFGLGPAIRATRLTPTLRVIPVGPTTARRSVGRMTLVGMQLAMCVVLVFGAGLLARTLRNLEQVDGRLATDAVVAFAIDANDTPFPLDRLSTFCAEAVDRLRRPGVVAGGCATMTPLDTAREVRTLGLPVLPPGREGRDVLANAVSPGFFASFDIGLVRGRLFTADDTAAAARVAILNESAVRHFFGDQDPLGRQIAFGSRPDPVQTMTVVGVVSDVRQAPREAASPMAYQPIDQLRVPPDYIVGAVRTTADAATIAGAVRGVIAGLGGGLTVSWVRSQREQMRAALATERLLAGLSGLFGLLALALAAIGVYGVIAYDVARRTREIGIRMALGARQRTVIATVLRQVGWIVVPGVAAGTFASLQASATVEAFLFGITPRDPWTLVMTAGVLVVTGFAAAALPARRAARVDPALTLRNE